MKAARIGLWVLSGLSFCAAAWGAPVLGEGPKVTVELVPDHPGPYTGAESFTVHVWLHSHVASVTGLRQVVFDFTDTDEAILLDPTFEFDMSSAGAPDGWWVRGGLPRPSAYFAWDIGVLEPPGPYLTLPAEDAMHIGSIGLALPDESGEYRMDILNADEPDLKVGGMFIYAFPGDFWRAYSGEIDGGTYDFVVVPEPVTLMLLAVGCLLLRRRSPCWPRGSTSVISG